MRQNAFLLITIMIFTAFFPGCVTKPKSIDDVYLSETSAADAERLRKIEENIVEKKKDKDKAEVDYAISGQVVAVSKTEVTMLESVARHLQEREKLYSLTLDNQKLAEEQTKIAKNDGDLKQSRAALKLNEAKSDESEAFLNVKKAELSVKVAELDYEKAKIAKDYQLKRGTQIEKDKMIDDKEYQEFLNNQSSELDKKSEKLRQAREKVEKIKSGKQE